METRVESTSFNDIRHYAAITAITSLVGILIAALLIWWQVITQPQLEGAKTEEMRLLGEYTRFFEGRVADLRSSVNAMATAPATQEALRNFDLDARRKFTAAMTAQHAYLARAEIFERGQAEIDLNARVPISFAALDLIRRAETREFVGPEVGLNQGGRIYAAQPITLDGSVRGVLLVVFDRSFLLEPLALFEPIPGTLEVLQTVTTNAPQPILRVDSLEGDRPAVKQPLSSSIWTVAFSARTEALTHTHPGTGLIAPFAVALMLIFAGVFFGFSRFARRVSEEIDQLTEDAINIFEGTQPKPQPYRLLVTRAAAQNLQTHPAAQAITQPNRSIKARPKVAPEPEPVDKDAAKVAAVREKIAGNVLLDENSSRSDNNFGITVDDDAKLVPADLGIHIDPEIFRAYDIRGITTTNLTEDVVYWIGRAFAAEAKQHGQAKTVVGRDGRHSGSALQTELCRGLTEGGMDVIDIGLVPTPVLYHATHTLHTGTGIMITGSHNPPEYNGLKMMIAGETLAEDRIKSLHKRLLDAQLSQGDGTITQTDAKSRYTEEVVQDITITQGPKVVVDCGNGVAGVLAPQLLRALGCEVIELYCDVNGDFPNHHPDPADAANLEDLQTVVKAEGADIGLAFDGDGDRLGVITQSGQIIWPDKLMMLFAQDIVSRNPGADIIFDVKCSRHLNNLVSDLGGRPIMWKTGHSHMKAKLKETGALLAGEFSGHICFGERWYGFDDALYCAARLLELLSHEDKTVDEVFDVFPTSLNTPEIKIVTTEGEKFKIMEQFAASADFGNATITALDGVRVDYADGWGLIRASNTSPVLTLRFEAEGPEALRRIQNEFQNKLRAINSNLSFSLAN